MGMMGTFCVSQNQSRLVACAGVSKPVDVASANGKSFLNMATGGFGTEAAKQTDSDLKDKVGGAAYLITGELGKVPLSCCLALSCHAAYCIFAAECAFS